MTRTWRQALRARRHGARYAYTILKAAERHNVQPSWALALCEQESGFRNVFGHDRGSILHGLKVTRARVQLLLRSIANGGISNGVGFTQLTWPPYIREAEARGGAHKVKVQIDVGVRILAGIVHEYGYRGAWHYNGDPRYQAQIRAKRDRWHRVIR